MPTNKLRTEDIKEIDDIKIDLSKSHPAFFVVEGDQLSAVLPFVSEQILSIAQKLSLTQVFSQPNATNPVILKEDLQQLIPMVTLGSFKDSVATFEDLPVDDNTIGDMRSVLNEGRIYRWTEDFVWQEFLRLGTLLHTSLTNLNSSSSYQHITNDQKTTVINETHTHPNFLIINNISSLGSGRIIEENERLLLPSPSQKNALIGTAYEPSLANRFVTSQDPRLNTLKNPYITYGPEGTVATFQKEDVANLIAALAYVANAEVRAVEVLPGLYRLNFSGDYTPVVWDSAGTVPVTVVYDPTSDSLVEAPQPYRQVENNALLLECMALRNTVFRFECFAPGLQLIGPGTSQATIRGLVFELKSDGTSGIKINRPNTLIEECTFRAAAGSTLAHGLKGIAIEAPDCVIRRCIFEGVLVEGLVVNAERTRIEDCQFNLSSSLSTALKLQEDADFTITNNCTFYNGAVSVEAQALSNLFTNCTHTADSPFLDSGTATRWLTNRPGRYQQAYIGRTRTVGGANSFADFVGNDQEPFIQAFSDPYTKEVLVLAGSTFIFTETVDIPEGVVVKSADFGSTVPEFVTSGMPAFNLKTRSSIIGLSFTGLNTNLVTVGTNQQRCEIKDCKFNVQSTGFYGVAAVGGSETLRIQGCSFTGSRGLVLQDSDATFVDKNHFATISMDVMSSGLTRFHVHENWFFATVPPVFSGVHGIVEKNFFLGGLPSKKTTSGTTWQENYPHARTNNEDGVDFLKMSLNSYLAPVPGTGASRALASGLNVLAFEETGNGTAVTLPIKFSSRIDRANAFEIHLYWSTNSVFSGDVLWDVAVTFRYRNGYQFGLTTSKSGLSTRNKLIFNQEQKAVFTFSASDYGFVSGIDVSHVSVIIRRLSDNALDTLAGTALLTEAQIILPRD